MSRFLGKVSAVQADMLRLAGLVLSATHPDGHDPDAEDDARVDGMRRAAHLLRDRTHQAFGYDLRAWHDHLVSAEDDRGYTHGYAWDDVRAEIEERLADPERERLAGLAQAADDADA